MLDKWNQELFEAIMNAKEISRQRDSKAAASNKMEPRTWYMENGVIVSKPYLGKESKAASISSNVNKVQVIDDFIFNNGRLN